ncbi:NADP oxidoreductase, coenzyme F420-dependent [Arthrobacter sp. Hiyo4]|nr:NADP oxidoreductase, coenzyme F420-dependent [Arthrobacter sp. Hiyo4]
MQEHLPASKVAKGFNHIRYSEITTDGTPPGTPNRRALATASDYAEASELVTKLYDEFGFDTVDLGRSPRAGARSRAVRRMWCGRTLLNSARPWPRRRGPSDV